MSLYQWLGQMWLALLNYLDPAECDFGDDDA